MWIKNLRQIYSLLVCLIASVFMMVSMGVILTKTLTLLAPEITNVSELAMYSSNDTYLRSYENRDVYSSEARNLRQERFAELKNMPEGELTALRTKEQDDVTSKITSMAKGTILETLVWLFVALFFFMTHWSLFRRSEKQSSNRPMGDRQHQHRHHSNQTIRPRS